jgi:hypothetical protein
MLASVKEVCCTVWNATHAGESVTATCWNEEQSLVARAAYDTPFLVALTARRQLSALQVPLPKRLWGSPSGRANAKQAKKGTAIAKILFIFESYEGKGSCQVSQSFRMIFMCHKTTSLLAAKYPGTSHTNDHCLYVEIYRSLASPLVRKSMIGSCVERTCSVS